VRVVAAKKKALDLARIAASTGAATEEIRFDEVPDGCRWCVQHVAARDDTSAFTRLVLGYTRTGVFRAIEDTPSPAAGTYYTFHEPIYLHEGDRLVLQFVGTTSGDVLRANILGFEEPAED
jgi:hypothetical protein